MGEIIEITLFACYCIVVYILVDVAIDMTIDHFRRRL